VPVCSTELRGKETFYAVPGNGNTCRQTAEAKDVHIVILHALSS
jgi:RNase P/RNase MRP subunit p30